MSHQETAQPEEEYLDERMAKAIRESVWLDTQRMLVIFLPSVEKVSVRMLDATDIGALFHNLQNRGL